MGGPAAGPVRRVDQAGPGDGGAGRASGRSRRRVGERRGLDGYRRGRPDRARAVCHVGIPVRRPGRADQALAMSAETAGVERALGAIGTTVRLMRLYPATHPAVVEALRQIGEALPALAALGTVEWKVGVTGLHWHGQHLLPRNAQIAELAGLLYARGVRAVTLNPGMVPEHVLALFQVATGAVPPDDGTLGRITLTLGRRT